jgi:hypothetical protein
MANDGSISFRPEQFNEPPPANVVDNRKVTQSGTVGGNTYDVFRYPSNVGEPGDRYPHMMMFFINVNTRSKAAKDVNGKSNTFDVDLTKKTANQGLGQTLNKQPTNSDQAKAATAVPLTINKTDGALATTIKEGLNSAVTKVNAEISETASDFKAKFGTSYKRLRTAIALYVPNSIKADYSTAYEEAGSGGVMGSAFSSLLSGQGLGNFAGNAMNETLRTGASVAAGNLGKIVGAAVGGVAGGLLGAKRSANAAQAGAASGAASGGLVGAILDNGMENTRALIDRATGQVVNPKKEVVFRHVQFRTHTFSYLFAPRNTTDVEVIKNIIKTFKMHMHPELPTDDKDSGMYLIMPDEFDIEFYSHGKENDFVHKIATSVLTDMSVDYTPTGHWSAFKQTGHPVMVSLSLTFRELEPLVRNQIEGGY